MIINFGNFSDSSMPRFTEEQYFRWEQAMAKGMAQRSPNSSDSDSESLPDPELAEVEVFNIFSYFKILQRAFRICALSVTEEMPTFFFCVCINSMMIA